MRPCSLFRQLVIIMGSDLCVVDCRGGAVKSNGRKREQELVRNNNSKEHRKLRKVRGRKCLDFFLLFYEHSC